MPATPEPTCPDCRELMERGCVIDTARLNQPKPASWARGEPRRSLWWGWWSIRSMPKKEIQAFRCRRCGLLRQYAL